MKHIYHIHGMTCSGCRSHVKETLPNYEKQEIINWVNTQLKQKE